MSSRWLMIATLAASSWGASAHAAEPEQEPEEPRQEERDEAEEEPPPPVGNFKRPNYPSNDG